MTLPPSMPAVNWADTARQWAYAYGRPEHTGRIKSQPEDFQVTEQMLVEPSGEGEHYWLLVSKTRQNTEQVAKQLARFCSVAYRDVGYSGMKDMHAVTQQWFSVWLPKGSPPDFLDFAMPGVLIEQVARHNRKIRRGTHQSNRFRIVVRDLPISPAVEQQLTERLQLISAAGVPNYYGPQRFGREFSNMLQSSEMLAAKRKVKNRNTRSILLSSARSWLFNMVLSQRIKANNWQSLHSGEPANLDGSGSIFNACELHGTDHSDQAVIAAQQQRLSALDIHPTGPLWGQFEGNRAVEKSLLNYPQLHQWEQGVIEPYAELAEGLCTVGLDYQRRALRMRVDQLEWQFSEGSLQLQFNLSRGQFATSVLREIIQLV